MSQPQYRYGQPYAPPQPKNGFGTAALVLGIVGIALSWIPVINVVAIIIGLIGFALAIPAVVRVHRRTANNGVATGIGAVLSAVAVIVSFVMLGAFAVAVDDAGKQLDGNTSVGQASPAAKPADNEPSQKAKAPTKPKTVLDINGSGIHTTETFSVSGDWDLHYTYDCSSLGFDGNFIAMRDGDIPELYVNELGAKGESVTHQHDGNGAMALKVNSTCDWTVKVVDLP